MRARAVLTHLAQKDVFADLIGLLSKDSESRLPKTRAWLVALAPFVDDTGVVRVGGRLRHADLPCSARHQSLLPTCHPWFAMWVKHLHVEYFHAGPSLILNVIRRSIGLFLMCLGWRGKSSRRASNVGGSTLRFIKKWVISPSPGSAQPPVFSYGRRLCWAISVASTSG